MFACRKESGPIPNEMKTGNGTAYPSNCHSRAVGAAVAAAAMVAPLFVLHINYSHNGAVGDTTAATAMAVPVFESHTKY